jgi:hypothetical protein
MNYTLIACVFSLLSIATIYGWRKVDFKIFMKRGI